MPSADHTNWPLLLDAIVAEPDKDAVRLVAADFLQETGDPDRAAFIRIQVELARLETIGAGNSLMADDLRKKERAFLGPLSVHRSLWAAEACPQLVRIASPSAGLDRLGSVRVQGAESVFFRRGFVEGVICDAEQWRQHGRAIRSRNPIQRLLLDGSRFNRGDWWALVPLLQGLKRIVLNEAGFSTGTAELMAWLQSQLPEVQLIAVADRPSAQLALMSNRPIT